MTEAFAMALLVSTPGLGYVGREKLLAEAGSARNAADDPGAYAHALGENALRAFKKTVRDAEALAKTFERERVHVLARGGEGYPPLLAQTVRPPHALFVQGEASLADALPFAVVGTRQADPYGLRQTRALAAELAGAGLCVVSGLALGVDAAAHLGALDARGRTVAVLGGALDRFYPAENRPLARRILESGGSIVSEFPMGMRPQSYSFLQRNHTIAGMSLGVLVTRGPLRSGAMRTANDALEEGREVFALPGNVDNALSAMPNKLIAEGARPVVCAQDILDALVVQRPLPAAAAQTEPAKRAREPQRARELPLPPGLDERERAVLTALSRGERDFDTLCGETGIPADEMGAALSMMELNGLVRALPGLRYARETS